MWEEWGRGRCRAAGLGRRRSGEGGHTMPRCRQLIDCTCQSLSCLHANAPTSMLMDHRRCQ